VTAIAHTPLPLTVIDHVLDAPTCATLAAKLRLAPVSAIEDPLLALRIFHRLERELPVTLGTAHLVGVRPTLRIDAPAPSAAKGCTVLLFLEAAGAVSVSFDWTPILSQPGRAVLLENRPDCIDTAGAYLLADVEYDAGWRGWPGSMPR
jgi:hypothetical protein